MLKTILADVILEFFSARFKASVAALNAETAPSYPLGRWDSVSMVEVRRKGWKVPNPNSDGRPLCHDTPHANRPHLVKRIGH